MEVLKAVAKSVKVAKASGGALSAGSIAKQVSTAAKSPKLSADLPAGFAANLTEAVKTATIAVKEGTVAKVSAGGSTSGAAVVYSMTGLVAAAFAALLM